MERGRTIFMLRQLPARTVIGKEVHVKNTPATAGTDHRGLFFKPIFMHYVKRAAPKRVWKKLFDKNGFIWGNQPAVDLLVYLP